MRGRLRREVADAVVLVRARLPGGRRALARQRLDRALVGLVAAQPQLAPQRRVVVLDRDRLDAARRPRSWCCRSSASPTRTSVRSSAPAVGVGRGRPRPASRWSSPDRRRRPCTRCSTAAARRRPCAAPSSNAPARPPSPCATLAGLTRSARRASARLRERIRRRARRARQHDQPATRRAQASVARSRRHRLVDAAAPGGCAPARAPAARAACRCPCRAARPRSAATSRLGLVADTGTKPDSAPQ